MVANGGAFVEWTGPFEPGYICTETLAGQDMSMPSMMGSDMSIDETLRGRLHIVWYLLSILTMELLGIIEDLHSMSL